LPPLDRNPSPPLTELPRGWQARIKAFDLRVDSELDRLRGNPIADRLFYAATELGDGSLIWHIIGAARALAPDGDPADALRLSVLLGGESILVNGGLKSLFRRTRPVWDQPRAFKIRQPRSSSFPSGHASSAFTAAAILSDDDPLRPLYYAIAAVVATSRVYVRIHHASDVVAGVAVGVVLGRAARRVWKKPAR
jgi:membrane-associated phospholipid phosphatase